MDFVINEQELEALCGLPHIQQLVYLRGIRPYMDIKTGVAGIRRRISHQSISEQLYIEPHQGIKSQRFSRDQVRRAVAGLARAGLIEVQSDDMQLILKCLFASRHYSVQNKAAINPPQKATINPPEQGLVNTGLSEGEALKAVTPQPVKATIPLNNDNYFIYLNTRFEDFWAIYPLKKARQKAWEVFQTLNPTDELITQILTALKTQIQFTNRQQQQGHWVAPWKYPANWLAQHCWQDELVMDQPKENHHAAHQTNRTKQPASDAFWDACKEGFDEHEEAADDNVIAFPKLGIQS
ncbi:hypothetical protein [Legionella spiritensis]|uniref:Legionella vir region protein n=1 Tax=Legionella spiritensis TaxID=452 RepID=A0A0W0Z8B7_LEGSP|nr:hypothetical protein [Legionella spiritensis]KTD65357.1 Legionella vir region protein [Legionella spiritensis]SNV47311.1 Legionella vir region protein [Legionella spiritensis]